MMIGSHNLRAKQARALSGAPPWLSGNSSRTIVSTGLPSTAAKSICSLRRTRMTKGAWISGSRCGIAAPPPIPVDPSSSRLTSSAKIRSGCRSRRAPALAANFSNRSAPSKALRQARINLDRGCCTSDAKICTEIELRIGEEHPCHRRVKAHKSDPLVGSAL